MKRLRRRRVAPFHVDEAGWVDAARRRLSPNHDPRPPQAAITLVIVHGISLPPGRFGGPGIGALFSNRLRSASHPYYAGIAKLRVSAHFLIRRRGELLQFVACGDRAWHAGVSIWRGREGCNDFSIGIELEGSDAVPYTARQYAQLGRLIDGLQRRYPIAEIAGHCDVAPGRKTDPGHAFDWPRLGRRLRRLTTGTPGFPFAV